MVAFTTVERKYMSDKNLTAGKGSYINNEINRFKALRYFEGSNMEDKANISTEKMSKMVDVSEATVKKLERKLDNNVAPPCKAWVLKQYHDRLGVSYEYLMGETTNKNLMNYQMGKDSILKHIDNSFWDNLRKSVTDDYSTPKSTDMERCKILEALLSNPDEFGTMLDNIFNALFQIYKIKSYKLPAYIKNESIGQQEYNISRSFLRLLNDDTLTHLTPLFKKHEKEINIIKENEKEIFSEIIGDKFNNKKL